VGNENTGVRRMCGIKILVFENVLKEMMCMMRIHRMKICKLDIVQIECLCIGRMLRIRLID